MKAKPVLVTVFSGLTLVGIVIDHLRVDSPHGSPWLLPGLLALGLAVILWTWGLRVAGRGWRRGLFLTAFSGAMVWIGMGGRDFVAGWQATYLEGYRIGAQLAAEDRAEQGLPPRPPKPAPLAAELPRRQRTLDLFNWVVLTAVLGTVLHRLQLSTERAQQQERLATEAREQALRARLAPHFLFNTLNILHAQIEHDPQGAQATTERLAWIFRQVLAFADRPTVKLAEECQLVEAYLGLEQARMGPRLRVRMEVPEALESRSIPPLALQVIVENAVKHGVAPLEQGGEILIRAEEPEAGTLRLSVLDPGPGSSSTKGSGTALATLRMRLARPEDLHMTLTPQGHEVSLLWKQA